MKVDADTGVPADVDIAVEAVGEEDITETRRRTMIIHSANPDIQAAAVVVQLRSQTLRGLMIGMVVVVVAVVAVAVDMVVIVVAPAVIPVMVKLVTMSVLLAGFMNATVELDAEGTSKEMEVAEATGELKLMNLLK
jgi:hypothetical protein